MCGSGVLPPTRAAPQGTANTPERLAQQAHVILIQPSLLLPFQIPQTSTERQNISGLLHMLTVNFADSIDGSLKIKGEAILKYFK